MRVFSVVEGKRFGSVRFSFMENRTVRCGAVRFPHFRNRTVRYGVDFVFQALDGAVRRGYPFNICSVRLCHGVEGKLFGVVKRGIFISTAVLLSFDRGNPVLVV